MAKSFNAMKKKNQSFEELADKLEKTNSNSNFKQDERFYYPELDKAKNGYAIIRFLPAPSEEELPWVKRYQHGFKGPGGWYIEECPTTVDNDCPLCKINSELVAEHGKWEETPEAVKTVIRKRKRKMGYVSNIYVVQDSKNPENEGKVFLFRYGKKIYDKIMDAVKPKFEDETPIDPFDLWKGADFKLKIRKVDGQVNYDSSTFEKVSQLLPSDKKLEEVWKKEYSLNAFVAPEIYKPIEKLEERLEKVMGTIAKSKNTETAASLSMEEKEEKRDTSLESKVDKATEKETAESTIKKDVQNSNEMEDDGDENTLAFFEDLANEDE